MICVLGREGMRREIALLRRIVLEGHRRAVPELGL